MLAGLVALVTWEVQTFGRTTSAAPAIAPPAVKAELVASPPLEGVQPAKVAETLALAEQSPASADGAALGDAAQHKKIAAYLSRKYQVSSEATQLIVSAAYLTGRDTGVDPMLILAVMAIESRFNPFAESEMGAQGLMQVIPRYHLDKFEVLGGKDAVLNPVANIKVGALILKDYISRFGGVEAGLKAYSGAAEAEEDGGYASKVLGERERIRSAAGVIKTAPVKALPKPVAPPTVALEAT
jgi:soluble lytic murein transglycosylase-like protein